MRNFYSEAPKNWELARTQTVAPKFLRNITGQRNNFSLKDNNLSQKY